MNITLNERAPTPLELSSAILLYQRENEALAVKHSVRLRKDGSTYLGPGHFVTADIVRSFGALLDQQPLTFLPENVVAVGRDATAWFEPAAVRTMFFKPHTDMAVAAFDGKQIPQPPLLFVARARSLRVFALLENERPTAGSALALAPYWNIPGPDGTVCLGSMALPKTVAPETTADISEAFFNSEFTHVNGTAKPWAHPGTYAELLRDAISAARFEKTWLKPINLRVSKAICGR